MKGIGYRMVNPVMRQDLRAYGSRKSGTLSMKIRLDDNNNIMIIDNDGRMDLRSTVYHIKFVFPGKNFSDPYIIKLPIIFNYPLLPLSILYCIEKQCSIFYAMLSNNLIFYCSMILVH